MASRPLLIGTRGSPLALWQARHVRTRLIEANGLAESDIDLSVITTSGDRLKDKPLRDFGGKGLFTEELEHALRAGEIDLAVHSLKDLPIEDAPGLTLGLPAICSCYSGRKTGPTGNSRLGRTVERTVSASL